MFTASFLTFMAIGGFPSFVEDMKVHSLIFIFEHINILLKLINLFALISRFLYEKD